MRLRALQPFPFCIVASASFGDGTIHPFATTRAKSFEWFWRVKLWTVTINLTTALDSYVIAIPNVQMKLDGVVATSERDLVCFITQGGGLFGIYMEGGGVVDEPGVDISALFHCALFSPLGDTGTFTGGTLVSNPPPWTTDGIRTNAGSDYPMFVFMVGVTGDDVVASDISTYDDSVATSSGSILTFDGHSVHTYSNSLGDITSVSCDPQEWWEYRRADGTEPIYDSATGAILPGMTPHTSLR
jgi:hypothetical protein